VVEKTLGIDSLGKILFGRRAGHMRKVNLRTKGTCERKYRQFALLRRGLRESGMLDAKKKNLLRLHLRIDEPTHYDEIKNYRVVYYPLGGEKER